MQSNTKKLLILFSCLALTLPLVLTLVLALGAAGRKPSVATDAPISTSSPPKTTVKDTQGLEDPVVTTSGETTPAFAETTSAETSSPAETASSPVERISPENYKPFYPDRKVVALTFDDGPGPGTELVLDTIEGTGDKVTFFINGYTIDRNPEERAELIRRGLEAGCEYGSHTYNHTFLYEEKTGNIEESKIHDELESLQLKFRTITGERMPQLMRPPGGFFDKKKDYGYALVLWSVDSEDWRTYRTYKDDLTSENDRVREEAEGKAADEIVKNVLKYVKSGDIVLMHDIYRSSAVAFARLYGELKARGYQLVTVSDLLQIEPEEFGGWYFYSAYSCGTDGNRVNAYDSASTYAALPPRKIGE